MTMVFPATVEMKMEDAIAKISSAIDAAADVIADELKKALDNGDWDGLPPLTDALQELHQMKSHLPNLQSGVVSSTSKAFEVEVTAGARRHSYLSATRGIKANLLKANQPVSLILGSQEVTTVVDGKYGRFRERGAIARFYSEQQVKAGDKLRVSLTAEGKWRVRKKRHLVGPLTLVHSGVDASLSLARHS